jgi:hypothetical protein
MQQGLEESFAKINKELKKAQAISKVKPVIQ